MLSQVIGLITDIGLGALALSVARSLKATLAKVVDIQADHEKRITALETRSHEPHD